MVCIHKFRSAAPHVLVGTCAESDLFRHIVHIEKAVQLANGDTLQAFQNDERFKKAADFSQIVDWTSIVTCVTMLPTLVAGQRQELFSADPRS